MEEHADRVEEVLDREDYVAVTEDTFAGIAIQRFREFEPVDDETTVYYLYVVDHDGHLVGVMSFRELLNAPRDEPVSEYMETDLLTIVEDADPEQAMQVIAGSDYPAVPVVDHSYRLVGVLRTEDLLEVAEEEATEDMMKSAGFSFADIESSRSKAILQSSLSRVLRLRLPWLFIALVGGLMAGVVVEGFEETLGAVLAVMFFVPVIMDMGGNVGTQASTIFVRGLATGHIDDRNAFEHFGREGLVGLSIGLIMGSLGGSAAYVWQGVIRSHPQAATIAFVVFVALVAVCMVASVIGFVIPWILHKLDFDPAAASNPLITTVKDVLALMIYFGLATALLAELL